MVSREYLDDERKKLWEKVLILEKEINNRPSDYEREAKSASKKASEYRNRCEDAKNTADEFVIEIKNKFGLIDDLLNDINKYKELSNEKSETIEKILVQSNENLDILVDRKIQLQKHLEVLEKAFEDHPELESEIESLNSTFTASDDLYTKIHCHPKVFKKIILKNVLYA